MKKWNQWKQKNLREKSDDVQLNALIGYLTHTHNIPRSQIKKDWYLLLGREDLNLKGTYEYVTEAQLKGRPVIHCADLMIFDNREHLLCLIELDGSIHHTVASKKTQERNADYHFAGIPCIVIDIEDLKETGQSWFDYLDQELAKLNI